MFFKLVEPASFVVCINPIFNHDIKGPICANVLASTPVFFRLDKANIFTAPFLVHAKRWHQALSAYENSVHTRPFTCHPSLLKYKTRWSHAKAWTSNYQALRSALKQQLCSIKKNITFGSNLNMYFKWSTLISTHGNNIIVMQETLYFCSFFDLCSYSICITIVFYLTSQFQIA